MPSRPRFLATTIQAGAAALALGVLAFWPPRHGPMLLVPLDATAGEAVGAALAAHAAILGTGPVPGSLVVLGDRASVSGAIGGRAIVLLAAPPAGCGTVAGSLSS